MKTFALHLTMEHRNRPETTVAWSNTPFYIIFMHILLNIEWCLTPFSTIFQLFRGGQCTYPCFPGVLLTSIPHNIFPSHWLLSRITIVETTERGERGMNPVAMTIINPRKEYWPSRRSNQRPPVHKSTTLPTELWSSAGNKQSCFRVV